MKVYRSVGQDSPHGLYGVTGIDFCCWKMSEDILFGKVKTKVWTDHPLYFSVNDYVLSHCGHCGAKIEGEVYREKDKEK